MKMSYLIVSALLLMTTITALLAQILENPFHILGCDASCVLLLGLLFGASLLAFDDYCKDKRGELGVLAVWTRKVLSYL